LSQELSAKRLALLKDAVPALTRVAILWYPGSRDGEQSVKETEVAARTLGVPVQVVGIRDPSELESAFNSIAFNSIKDVHGLIAVPSTMFFDSRAEIARLALRHRLSAIFPEKEFVDAGGLMAYGANLSEEFRRAATYVDKILQGAKPAALPVEQPTKFELVVNLKTAKALGVTIPPLLLLRADQVIE
jgi:putative ABC transport system substrate-binding protein